MKTINLKVGDVQVEIDIRIKSRFQYHVVIYVLGVREFKHMETFNTFAASVYRANDLVRTLSLADDEQHSAEIVRYDTVLDTSEVVERIYSYLSYHVSVSVKRYKS